MLCYVSVSIYIVNYRYSIPKGYGFIVPDDGSPDIFVHNSEIFSDGFRSLKVGEKVEFNVEWDYYGRSRAVDVTGPDGVEVQGLDSFMGISFK